ncbi:TRAP transporter large permease subunit [Campylobacter sp. RM9333]|uniref:CitMHS family transporter n=1 Tax=Campylobacter sp. RM9333 TaxID=2735731 RepID=UPI001DB19454|nr:TRAP transporter large permease subunit [Campylobacter sp. RM9333]
MDLFLSLTGFIGLGFIVWLLLKDKTTPAIAFILVSFVVAAMLMIMDYCGLEVGKALGVKGDVLNFKAMKGFIKDGVNTVSDTAALFVFSILFFSVLSASGFFNKIINFLLSKVTPNVFVITILTSLMAMFVHLDGSGAATFLIVIPAMLPIYERLGMRKSSLLLICASAMGVMNVLPWGGPTLRAATVIEADANDLWHQLIPMQVLGLVLALALAIFIGYQEKRRGAGGNLEGIKLEIEKSEFQNDKFFLVNVFLLIAVIAALVINVLPSYVCFMIGFAIALPLNYPNLKIAKKVVDKASSGAIMMYITLIGAGILIGVFDKSGIMNKMGASILTLVPNEYGNLIPLVVGLLAVPMALIFCTDSYFYGVMPVVLSVTNAFGIDPMNLAIIMVLARNCATFISPVVPATLLGCGLADVSIKEHIKRSFFYIWAISIICLIFGYIAGIIPHLF